MHLRTPFPPIRALPSSLNTMVGSINSTDAESKIKLREYNRYKRFRYILSRIHLRYSFGVFEI